MSGQVIKLYPNGRELPESYTVEFEHLRVTNEEAQRGREVYTTFGTKVGMHEWIIRLNTISRPAHALRSLGYSTSAKGGKTIAKIFLGDDHGEPPIATGIAWCSPFDNYDAVRGRTIAIGRALKALAAEQDTVA